MTYEAIVEWITDNDALMGLLTDSSLDEWIYAVNMLFEGHYNEGVEIVAETMWGIYHSEEFINEVGE